jgi:hypothetical protein
LQRATTQEIYISWVQDITMCCLEHWFEAVGRYATIDIQDINISIEEKSRLQQWLIVVKHLKRKPVEKL